MKILRIVLVLIVVAVVAIALCKNIIARKATTAGIKAGTGLQAEIDDMNVGITNTRVGIDRLRLMNPPGFHGDVMMNAPEIYVDYELKPLLKKKVHLEEVRLNLQELCVVRNEKGELNLNALRTIQKGAKAPEEKKEKGKAPEMLIDLLKLRIGKVVFKDYSGGKEPVVREFDINVDKTFENISDPRVLTSIIVVEALKNTAIAKLVGFDLASLQKGVSESLAQATDQAKEALQQQQEEVTRQARETIDQATGEARKAMEEQKGKAAKALKGIMETEKE